MFFVDHQRNWCIFRYLLNPVLDDVKNNEGQIRPGLTRKILNAYVNQQYMVLDMEKGLTFMVLILKILFSQVSSIHWGLNIRSFKDHLSMFTTISSSGGISGKFVAIIENLLGNIHQYIINVYAPISNDLLHF